MRLKYKIDRDTRTLILKYIRKYDEYKIWYRAERERIMSIASKPCDGMPHGSETSNKVLSAVVRIEKIENSHRAKVVRAIDSALDNIGIEIVSDDQREKLKKAIWKSCLNAREYPFEAFAGFIPYERRQFYYCKNMFLNDIKNALGL